MTVTVNGEERDVAADATVKSLIVALGIERPGIAVALNDRVLPAARWPQTALAQGDRLEIIVAVAGG